jgi:DNA-binding response OmpR family regulator
MPAAKRLLIVDDEPSILTGMRRFLLGRGYVVDCAQEKEEAEALLDHRHYDGVIADLCLTTGFGPDGLSLIAHARESCPETRVLVLTALEGEATEELATKLGAHAFLRKPSALSEIASVLEALLGARP